MRRSERQLEAAGRARQPTHTIADCHLLAQRLAQLLYPTDAARAEVRRSGRRHASDQTQAFF